VRVGGVEEKVGEDNKSCCTILRRVVSQRCVALNLERIEGFYTIIFKSCTELNYTIDVYDFKLFFKYLKGSYSPYTSRFYS